MARWRWAVTGAFALGGVTITAWGPRLPAIKAQLGIGTATIGLMLAGVTVGSMLGMVVSTPLLHRAGGRRAMATALGAVAAALALMGTGLVAGSVALVAVAFVVVGAGIGSLDVLINVEGSAVERTAGRTLMPLMHGAWSVGAAVGAGIGAACAATGVSPAAQLIGEAALVALATSVVAAGVPAGNRAALSVEGPRRSRGESVRHWLRGWANRRLLLIGLVMLGVELGEGSANSWLTLAVRTGHGQTAAVAALFFASFATAEALTRIFSGPVIDRLGRVATIRVTTALGVLGMVLFIVSGNRWSALAGVVLWAVGVSMGFPLGMSSAAESGPDPAAQVSVVASVGYMANLAGPPAIGALAESAGLLPSLWLVAALFVAAFAAAGSLGASRHRARPATAVGTGELPGVTAGPVEKREWAAGHPPPTGAVAVPGDH